MRPDSVCLILSQQIQPVKKKVSLFIHKVIKYSLANLCSKWCVFYSEEKCKKDCDLNTDIMFIHRATQNLKDVGFLHLIIDTSHNFYKPFHIYSL